MKKKTLLMVLLIASSFSSLSGQINNALVLDGCTNYLEVPENDALDFDQGLTIEAWVYPNCADGNRVILSKQWCQGQYGYYLSINNGRLFWSYSSSGFCTNSSTYQSVDALIPAQAFSHVAVVHTANSIDLFVNGIEVASEQNNGNLGAIANSNEPFRIGAYKNISGGISNYFSGLVDEIRVWNTTLNETQINERMNTPLAGGESGLVLYFNMEDVGEGPNLSLTNQATNGTVQNAGTAGFTDQSPYFIPYQDYDEIGIELENEVVAGNEIITCDETIDLLLAPSDYKSILWSTGATTPFLTVSETDFYWVEVETELCRFYRDTFIVEVDEVFVIDGAYELCEGSSITIVNETYSDAGLYFEDVPGTDGCDTVYIHDISLIPSIDETFLSFAACPDASIIYDGQALSPGSITPFTYTAANGCDSVVTVEVTALSTIEEQLILETCPDTPIVYEGVALAPGSSTPFAFTSAEGCDSILTVEVTTLPAIETQLELQSCPATPFIYEGTPLLPGSSTPFTFVTSEGCDSIVTVQVSAYPLNTGFLGDDMTSCADQLTLNSPTSRTTWEDGTTGNSRIISESGSFTATYTDSLGCVQKDTIEVNFLRESIYVPSAFSPNADGVNDCFRPYFSTDLALGEYELQIFNRWGALIFSSTDLNACWDGRFQGKSLNPDIFAWTLRTFSTNCNEAVYRKGDVLLLR